MGIPTERLENVKAALIILWIIVPTVQYFGTVQRTNLLLGGTVILPDAAVWDLTPLYLVLLFSTVIVVLLSWLLRNKQTEIDLKSGGGSN